MGANSFGKGRVVISGPRADIDAVTGKVPDEHSIHSKLVNLVVRYAAGGNHDTPNCKPVTRGSAAIRDDLSESELRATGVVARLKQASSGWWAAWKTVVTVFLALCGLGACLYFNQSLRNAERSQELNANELIQKVTGQSPSGFTIARV